MKHILSTKQFLDRDQIETLFSLTDECAALLRVKRRSSRMSEKLFVSLFYEESTRTRFSFEAAIFHLGGSCISTEDAMQFSSVSKGESLEHTIRVLSGYGVAAIVLRHPDDGAAERASLVSGVSIINAGDGVGEHPTQGLLDFYTIWKEKGRIDDLEVTLAGDLKHGRTVHSLVYLLSLGTDIRVTLASPESLRLPARYRDFLKRRDIPFAETHFLDDAVAGADVVYMTRVQESRFKRRAQYEQVKNAFIFDESMLSMLKSDATLMHPMPINNEIAPAVDNDSRAAYFRQATNGVPVRMALLRMLHDKEVS